MEQIVQVCLYIKKQNCKNCEERYIVITTEIMLYYRTQKLEDWPQFMKGSTNTSQKYAA